jgi:hypothetical protein
MVRDDSPTPAEDAPTEGPAPVEDREPAGPVAHSGSRWEPRDDAGAPDEGSDTAAQEQATAVGESSPAGTIGWHGDTTTSVAAPGRHRRGLRVAAGVGAAVLLAGGGFGVGYAVGDSGPDGGAGPAVGHHRGHDGSGGPRGQADQGGTGQGGTGENTAGQHTSGTSSPILGGLFT